MTDRWAGVYREGRRAIRHWPVGPACDTVGAYAAAAEEPMPTRLVLFAVKGIHTIAFWVIASSIVLVVVDGVFGRPRRRTGLAAGIALAESAVFAANGFVCPLTPLAERYGARRGSVSDIFLPDVVARNLTWASSLALVAGLALNVRALRRRRARVAG